MNQFGSQIIKQYFERQKDGRIRKRRRKGNQRSRLHSYTHTFTWLPGSLSSFLTSSFTTPPTTNIFKIDQIHQEKKKKKRKWHPVYEKAPFQYPTPPPPPPLLPRTTTATAPTKAAGPVNASESTATRHTQAVKTVHPRASSAKDTRFDFAGGPESLREVGIMGRQSRVWSVFRRRRSGGGI